MRLFGIAIAILTAIIILSFTFRGGDGVGPVSDFDFGPQALTGILLKADVSLTRRGTHLLVIDGKPEMYVESKTVTLSPFEALSGGRSHFRIEDLLQLVTLIARQREAQDGGMSGADKQAVSRK